jgi:uncharacterized protein involved in type VI secretion and phage assembly
MTFDSHDDLTALAFPGLYVAGVEDPDDRDKRGRILVSVPAVFGKSDAEFLVWARPCFPPGHFFVPAKGEKVWVAFENGDPTAPVWLGVLYPAGSVPPESDVSPPVKRVIKTPAKHVVLLDDTSGSEAIEITDTEHKLTLRFDKTGITIRSDDKDLVLTNGKVTLKLSGTAVAVS